MGFLPTGTVLRAASIALRYRESQRGKEGKGERDDERQREKRRGKERRERGGEEKRREEKRGEQWK
jgi:hypothetical protein